MPRPSLGAAAKTRVINVRVTKAEERQLIARYGTPTRALRTLIASVTTHPQAILGLTDEDDED